MIPEGTTPFESAVARAMAERIGIGAATVPRRRRGGSGRHRLPRRLPARGARAPPAASTSTSPARRTGSSTTGSASWARRVWFDPRLQVGYRPRGRRARPGQAVPRFGPVALADHPRLPGHRQRALPRRPAHDARRSAPPPRRWSSTSRCSTARPSARSPRPSPPGISPWSSSAASATRRGPRRAGERAVPGRRWSRCTCRGAPASCAACSATRCARWPHGCRKPRAGRVRHDGARARSDPDVTAAGRHPGRRARHPPRPSAPEAADPAGRRPHDPRQPARPHRGRRSRTRRSTSSSGSSSR